MSVKYNRCHYSRCRVWATGHNILRDGWSEWTKRDGLIFDTIWNSGDWQSKLELLRPVSTIFDVSGSRPEMVFQSGFQAYSLDGPQWYYLRLVDSDYLFWPSWRHQTRSSFPRRFPFWRTMEYDFLILAIGHTRDRHKRSHFGRLAVRRKVGNYRRIMYHTPGTRFEI